ncbi:hypothetical protein JQF37_04920 [Pseudomonas sp. MIL9]|uniref:hypothetical protein n=1 Tax=Pseudomonas sp. MIL9 TaxID=2807620 RepID=UPI0019505277|nr:hypothetical protein [Pseudomonas sp. MIL9]MBM6442963.1 hypothetical protein [Pseudomonas sp. MIL9]
MNGTQTPIARTTRVHRNLASVATPATLATLATALWGVVCRRCHPIQKVATTGNTHLSFTIRERANRVFWSSLLPVKILWQQNSRVGNGWSPRIPGLLSLLPVLPVFFESLKHMLVKDQGQVTL